MTLVKAQLRAFYAAQGLTGNHRRKAMQYDLKQVNKLRNHAADMSLMFLFVWSCTPQGGNYWALRDQA